MHIEYIKYLFTKKHISEKMKALKEYSSGAYWHSIGVAILAVEFLPFFDEFAEITEQIVTGALLHDIGKSYVPKRILQKTEALNMADWELIRKHPEVGRIFLGDGFTEIENEIVLCHHSVGDGTGYPAITEAPEYVQFVTALDKYEAMAAPRRYKEPFSHEKIINILYEEAEQGKVNKKYVDLLKDNKLLNSGWLEYMKQVELEFDIL